MTNNIPRRVTRPIQLRANNSADIPDRNLHGVGGGALRLSADVDGRPGEAEGHGGVDACGGEEGAGVGDAGFVGWVGVCEQDYVAYDGDCGGEQDEGTPASVAFGDDGVDYCEDCGEGLEARALVGVFGGGGF